MADNLGVNPFQSLGYDPYLAIIALVCQYADDLSEDDKTKLDMRDVCLVWFSKSLGNWKGLAITSRPDGLYYEITHNGETDTTYVDVYEKKHHYEVDFFKNDKEDSDD